MSVVLLSGSDLESDGGDVGSNAGGNVQVQLLGPAVLVPSQAIGNVVARTNDLLAGHREWLNSLPQRGGEEKLQNKVRDVPASLITSPPSLNPRFAAPQSNAILPECSGFVASASASASNAGAASASSVFAISLSSVSSTASQSIASLQTSLSSASSALASAQNSASVALASANANASAASSALTAAQSSASSSISVAQVSASSAVASASAAIQSANALASQAQVSATLARAQAEASISGINQQASENVRISMNNLKFALIITFSILGSSLATIIAIYLLLLYRRRRRHRKSLKIQEFKDKIEVRHHSEESHGPSLSEFPMPANRKTWNEVQGGGGVRSEGRPSSEVVPREVRKTWANGERGSGGGGGDRRSAEFPFAGRKTWSVEQQRRMTEGERERERPRSRKNTLTYDADYPDQPPRFGSWLGELRKNEDPLEVKRGKGKGKKEKGRRSVDEGSEIGTAF